jgi:hypothetical protein
MRRDRGLGVRFGSVLVLAAAAVGAALAPAAAFADDSGGSPTPQVAGYTVTAQGIGAQWAFQVPNLIPLPGNLLEADVAFARTLVSSGPQVDAIGAYYYPGDILANLGGLESEFFPPRAPNTGNWPLMARAEYPANAVYGSSDTKGATYGSPVPVLTASANASQNGGNSTGTLTDLVAGPGMGRNGAPLLDAASVQSSNTVTIGASTVSAVANTVVKTIDIAGMIDITQLTSDSSSTSDGTTGTPTASLHVGQVTVEGEPAYIDDQGVHVNGNTTYPPGAPTPAQLQQSLNTTLSQDGVSVRLVDPQQTVSGAEGIGNSGGLVITISHNFSVPFVNPGATTGALTGGSVSPPPCIDTEIPDNPITGPQSVLGVVCPPAGDYTAVTSISLGFANTDVNASAVVPSVTPACICTNIPGPTDTGGTFEPSTLPLLGGETTAGNLSGQGVGTASPQTAPSGFSPQGLRFPIRGIPAPVGWIAIGFILCVLFAYPMMLLARWQFLVGRR